jgi:hypothetical protein
LPLHRRQEAIGIRTISFGIRTISFGVRTFSRAAHRVGFHRAVAVAKLNPPETCAAATLFRRGPKVGKT